MPNPTIEELQNPEKYELIAELHHQQIKEFVIDKLAKGGKLTTFYMIYQLLMVVLGIFFATRSVVQFFQNNVTPLYYTLAALVFSFSVLIVLHELIHGIALKFVGAKKVNYGVIIKRFIFYAEADKTVLNRNQFTLVALAPLLVVQLLTLVGVLVFLHHPAFYAVIFIMSTHSLFCAGDIGLLSIFYKYGHSEIYSYDVKATKTSYYYKEINAANKLNSIK